MLHGHDNLEAHGNVTGRDVRGFIRLAAASSVGHGLRTCTQSFPDASSAGRSDGRPDTGSDSGRDALSSV